MKTFKLKTLLVATASAAVLSAYFFLPVRLSVLLQEMSRHSPKHGDKVLLTCYSFTVDDSGGVDYGETHTISHLVTFIRPDDEPSSAIVEMSRWEYFKFDVNAKWELQRGVLFNNLTDDTGLPSEDTLDR